jgi:hypothetical protein
MLVVGDDNLPSMSRALGEICAKRPRRCFLNMHTIQLLPGNTIFALRTRASACTAAIMRNRVPIIYVNAFVVRSRNLDTIHLTP